MKPLEYYKGREQTYLKHFFLERYLERVTYNIGSFANEFVYVDGFSGPWKSGDEALEDTSFMIAIKKLREVREGLAKIGRTPTVRCLFVEKDPESYRALEAAVRHVSDIQVQPLNGDFERSIPEVLKFVGRRFPWSSSILPDGPALASSRSHRFFSIVLARSWSTSCLTT